MVIPICNTADGRILDQKAITMSVKKSREKNTPTKPELSVQNVTETISAVPACSETLSAGAR